MRTKPRIRFKAQRWSALAVGTAMAASAPPAPAAQEWFKHFRIGMQLALNIDAEFTLGGTFNVKTRPGIYDDGYVLPDSSPSGAEPELTTNWGYESLGQVSTDPKDPNIRTIFFSRTESFSTEAGNLAANDSPYLGLELAYGGPIARVGGSLIGWELGYSMLPISISDTRTLNGFATRLVEGRNVPEGVELPDPPYNGTPSGREQPVIELNPSSSDFIDEDATVRGPRTLDVYLHNLRFGPTIHYEFARRWAVQGSAGGAVGLVLGEYRFNETITAVSGASRRNTGSIGTSEVVYGGYLNGVVLFHVEEHGDIYAGVQFMSLSDTEVNGEGRGARLDLGAAFSFLVGVNWPF